MIYPLLTVSIQYERDVVTARQRARQLASLLGFESQDQTRIATAVSEVARNAFAYAGGGKVEFTLEGRTPPQLFVTKISDTGRGIADLSAILEGRYRSPTGMGVGLLGAKRLMDSFDIRSTTGGTTVWLRKLLSAKAALIGPDELKQVSAAISVQRFDDPIAEVQRQNQELLRTLEELRRRQDELTLLNRELEDTNRGVVALYAELEERADHLRRVDEVKTRFLSNMTHEFRTPVNSILAISGLLMDRADGDLNSEQEKQVGFVRKAANDLSELVNDLLDLARVEAGKVVIRPVEFEVTDLFGALRGMLRPLLVTQSISLIFEEPTDIPALDTDESKVSQVLRNFISNALKFTERGEIRVRVAYESANDRVSFSVTDTGIGIAPDDQPRIFEEFGQVENPIQRRVKGTGLGLPLSRRLAELLGGSVAVESQVGVGSTFTLHVPRRYRPQDPAPVRTELPAPAPDLLPILAIEDQPEDRHVFERLVRGSHFQLVSCENLRQAREVLGQMSPRAILLDVMLRHQDSWKFLAELKGDPTTARIPVLIVTSLDDKAKAFSLGADAYCVKPVDRTALLDQLEALSHRRTALIVDDDEASRYTLRQMIRRAGWDAIEAVNGEQGLREAEKIPVRVIFLDLSMPGLGGHEVLRQLRQIPRHRDTPVFISSSAVLGPEELKRLEVHHAQVMPKGLLGPAGIAAALEGVESRRPALSSGTEPPS